MVKMLVVYEGNLHTAITHEPSGQVMHTDAPKDNQGQGNHFSPTDLVGAALASCVATMLGLYAKQKGLDFRGMSVSVEKEMSQDQPRRVGKLKLEVVMPIDCDKEAIKRVTESCPVYHSLHPDIEIETIYSELS